MRWIHTESETVRKAKEATVYSLRELVGNEVDDWPEEKVRHEIYKSADIILSEAKGHNPNLWGVYHDRAVTLYIDDMSRISRDLVRDDISDEELVKEKMFWPNKMDKWACREIVEEMKLHDISHAIDAREEVIKGITRKLTEGMDFEV